MYFCHTKLTHTKSFECVCVWAFCGIVVYKVKLYSISYKYKLTFCGVAYSSKYFRSGHPKIG